MSSGCSCASGSWLPAQCPGAMQADTELPWGWLCLAPGLWVLPIPCPVLGLCSPAPWSCSSAQHLPPTKQDKNKASVQGLCSHHTSFLPSSLGVLLPLEHTVTLPAVQMRTGAHLTCTQQIKLLRCCLIFCCCQSSTGCCCMCHSFLVRCGPETASLLWRTAVSHCWQQMMLCIHT